MSSTQYHSYATKDGHGLPHDPFKAIIAPRPIGWISSQDSSGGVNLAPYSFFNAVNAAPPIIAFSSIGYKDTVKNCEQTGEFCWNLVSRTMVQAMNESSASVAPTEDEFIRAGLSKKKSDYVAPPQVAGCPATMECKVTQILQLQDIAGQLCESWVVFGQVVAVHIDKEYLHDGVFQTAKAQPAMRAGGLGDYFYANDDVGFYLPRPSA